MSKIFFGGSRSLGRLNPAITTRLRNVIANNHTVLIGDASGVDKAIQSFFATEGYRNLVVYCMDGDCRNNVGDWRVKSIDSCGKKKDFAYFAMKDAQMSADADYGFMIWDGESKGTLNNVLNLIQQGKSALVYRSASQEFLQINAMDDVVCLVAGCSAEVMDYLNKKIKLEMRIAASNQTALGL